MPSQEQIAVSLATLAANSDAHTAALERIEKNLGAHVDADKEDFTKVHDRVTKIEGRQKFIVGGAVAASGLFSFLIAILKGS